MAENHLVGVEPVYVETAILWYSIFCKVTGYVDGVARIGENIAKDDAVAPMGEVGEEIGAWTIGFPYPHQVELKAVVDAGALVGVHCLALRVFPSQHLPHTVQIAILVVFCFA